MLEEMPFCKKKKSASLPVGQNEKVFHQRNKFPSCFAHWCFQKLFSFTSIVPSQLLVFLCSRHSLGLTLQLGSRCWLRDRSVSATCFDKNRLFPAGFWRVFLFFSVFLLSCFEPFISLRARVLRRCAQLFFLMLFYFLHILRPFLKHCPSRDWESPKFSFSFAD